MPIRVRVTVKPVSKQEFYDIDYLVLGLAYKIHNEMGRFWDEKIYHNELVYQCQKAGFDKVDDEVLVEVSYLDFKKTYKIDLLINNAVIYELKTEETITNYHSRQVLNYLLLMGMQHGKIINFYPSSVKFWFVSTQLTPAKRFNFSINDRKWRELDQDSAWLKQLVINLLNEWGAFLETKLFYNAITHFRGGAVKVVKKIKVLNNAQHVLGTQRVHLLNPDVAFKITAITKNISFYEQHLARFIRYTSLKALQWINFNHNEITLQTIIR